MSQNIAFGVQIGVIGFSVVMVALFSLYLILLLFNKVFSYKEREKVAPAAVAGMEIEPAAEGLSSETVAVVTAAIAAYTEASRGFQIKRIFPAGSKKRTGSKGSNWVLLGRRNQVNSAEQLALLRRERKR